ncbi:MAG: MATE family efflux transporter [Clostridia bacterium]|nr:MATE family efflux transporter [Clostridia bacterium]
MDKKFYKQAAALAIPIALQNLLTSCASLIDTAMVVVLGDNATAALGVAVRWSFLLNVVCFGFCSGSATLISQYWGAGDKSNIRKTYGQALMMSMIVVVAFTLGLALFPKTLMRVFISDPVIISLAADYARIYAIGVVFLVFSQITCAALKATARVYVPLISSAAAVVVNTFLNYCLINGNFGFPKLEIRGAAIATVIGLAVQALIVLLFVCFGKTDISTSPKNIIKIDKELTKKYLKISAPVIFNESMWAIGTNIYVMVLARQGTEYYSGYTIFETVQQLFFVFFVGIGHACAVMVGASVGKGETEVAYKNAKRFAIMTPLAGVILGFLSIVLRNPILSLMSIETELARTTASTLLLIYGCWLGIRMVQYTMICGVFRAGGDTKTGFKYDVLSLYCISIPAVILAGFVFNTPFVLIVAIMFIAEDVPKAILCIRHFKSRKWIIKLTDETR